MEININQKDITIIIKNLLSNLIKLDNLENNKILTQKAINENLDNLNIFINSNHRIEELINELSIINSSDIELTTEKLIDLFTQISNCVWFFYIFNNEIIEPFIKYSENYQKL